jgi:hypothetical protein
MCSTCLLRSCCHRPSLISCCPYLLGCHYEGSLLLLIFIHNTVLAFISACYQIVRNRFALLCPKVYMLVFDIIPLFRDSLFLAIKYGVS